MEPAEKYQNRSVDRYGEEKDPRVNCFECFANTPCYNAISAQYCIRQSRPRFLSFCPFRRRLRMEFALSRKALRKFLESMGARPVVEQPDEDKKSSFTVWELARSMSDWMKNSVTGSLTSKKAPIIEEPIPRIKEFPLTQESKKKHIEKETAKKKEEKQETVLMLKKKQQELKRLKDELSLQTEKQYCHYEEKLADYEEEKMYYLQKLAKDHHLNLKDLIRNGDLIYQNYRSELRKLNERKMKEIEKRAEVNARLLQEELTRQKQMKKLKSTSVPKFIKKRVKEASPEPVQEDIDDSKNTSSLLWEPIDSKTKVIPEKNFKSKAVRSAHTLRPRPKFFEHDRENMKSKSPEKPSKVNEELKVIIKKLENVWTEIEKTWSEEKKEPELPDNNMLIVRPTSIVFKDFLPYDDFIETVNVYNPTKEAIDCGFFKCHVEPKFDETMFQVYPESVLRVRPGGNENFQVIFMTERWDEVKYGIHGTIWFWSKVVKTNIFYRISVSVQCIRFTSNIKIENPIIEFNQVPSWVRLGATKYLEITNNSKIDYEVFIHRKEGKIGEESLTRSSTELIEEAKSQSGTIQNTVSSSKNVHQSQTKLARKTSAPTSLKKTKRRNKKGSIHSEPLSNEVHNQERIIPYERRHSQIPKKLAINEESFLTVKNLLDLMIEEVHQPFRIQLTRGVYLDRETRVCVPIEFFPRLAGDVERVEDQLVVSFEGKFLTKDEEVVTLIATMFELPISISPSMVDMQVTMVGTGVWQTSFQVTNVTNKFVKVMIQIPDKLTRHFQARPKNFIIRPKQKEDVLIRARIGWNIYQDSGDRLDKTLSLLEFPIGVQANDLPVQTLGTLAVISHPLAISIEPKTINLGFVNTFETIVEEFWLKNHTVIPLYFAFINVPECCLIMPMYGFSKIGPAQKIKLHLLYSPGVREAGGAGGQAVHMFTLICTTLERLAAEKAPLPEFNPDEEVVHNHKSIQYKTETEPVATLHELLKMQSEDYSSELGETSAKNIETLSFLSENLNAVSFLEKKEVITPLGPLTVSKRTKILDAIYPGENPTTEKSTMKLDIDNADALPPPKDKNLEPFISLNCMAIVTDTTCELSAQEIILPDTPYGSFSFHHIHLRCPNEVSGVSCHCKRFLGLHDDPRHPKMKFQFFHSAGKELDVQPVSGNLNYGEKVKIYLILRPELDMLEAPKEGKSRKKTLGPKSTSKTKSDTKQLPKKGESHISKSKLLKIKNMSDARYRARLKCLISIKEEHCSEPRYEELYCDIFSTFKRPDIYVATPNLKKEVTFPKTAIGSKRVEVLEVYNTSNKLVYVTRSHFSHKDVFECQPLPPSPSSYNQYKGIPLEPDQYLKLRLTFIPVEENYAEEYFELKANNTIIPLKVSGYGAIPRYSLSSHFCVCKLEASPGSKVEDIITITNKCEVELQFEITKCFQMETTNTDVFQLFLNRYMPAKSVYKETFLDPSIIADIEENFYESDQPSPIIVEPHLISVLPSKKGTIKISFNPKKPINISSAFIKVTSLEDANIQEAVRSSGGKEDQKPSQKISFPSQMYSRSKFDEATPTYYVQKVQLVLGRLTLVAEWFIIGKIAYNNKKRS